jgi:hypothetical protein
MDIIIYIYIYIYTVFSYIIVIFFLAHYDLSTTACIFAGYFFLNNDSIFCLLFFRPFPSTERTWKDIYTILMLDSKLFLLLLYRTFRKGVLEFENQNYLLNNGFFLLTSVHFSTLSTFFSGVILNSVSLFFLYSLKETGVFLPMGKIHGESWKKVRKS